MKSNAVRTLPRAARFALAKLGEDIALARKKRRISTISMAERAFISRNTLYKMERGEPCKTGRDEIAINRLVEGDLLGAK